MNQKTGMITLKEKGRQTSKVGCDNNSKKLQFEVVMHSSAFLDQLSTCEVTWKNLGVAYINYVNLSITFVVSVVK